jgi:SAM-dependent methyltransferase
MPQQLSNADQIASWNGEVGAKWVAAQSRLDRLLAGVTAELFAAARVAPGESVLDIGCGCGDTALQLASRARRVVGVDVSEPMLAQAKKAAAAVGAGNAELLLADASDHAFRPEFDLLFSRFGVMFFADPTAAFANLRRALKPNGRLAFVCWRDWRENEWVRETTAAVRPYAPPQPQTAPDAPGPFAFADKARVERILEGAGFKEIQLRAFDDALFFGDTAEKAVAHLMEFGPVSRMLTGATDEQRARAADALGKAIAPFAERTPLTMGGAMWIVTART